MARLTARSAYLALALGLAGCSKETTSDVLAETAIAGPVAEQEKAVLELGRRGPEAIPQLRRVMAESKIPIVRAAAMQSLGAFQDYPSGPSLFAALDDPDENVRGRAAGALTAIIGADYHYNAKDPPERRAKVVRGMKQSYEQMKQNPDMRR